MKRMPVRSPAMRCLPSVLGVLVCCLVAFGCGGGCGYGDRHMTRKVADAEIVGMWRMTDASRQLLKRDGYVETPGKAYTITFRSDGTLDIASAIEGVKGAYDVDGSGTWRLQHDKKVDNETVRANVLEVVAGTRGGRLSLAEEGGKLRLWSYYGDPDSWEFIEYERQ